MPSASPHSGAGSDAAHKNAAEHRVHTVAAKQDAVAQGTAKQHMLRQRFAKQSATPPLAAAALSAAPSSFPLEQSEKRAFLRRLATAPVLLGLVLWLALHYDVAAYLANSAVQERIAMAGWRGAVLFITLTACFTACGVPRQLCALAGGHIYGLWAGMAFATLGSGLGCLMTFSYARFVGQAWLYKKFATRFARLNAFLRQSPFLLTVCVRIIPLGSNFLTNIGAGVCGFPAKAFLAGSLLGFAVQNGIFAAIGAGIAAEGAMQGIAGLLLYALSLCLGLLLYRRYKQQA